MGIYTNSGLLAKVETNVGKLEYDITSAISTASVSLSISDTSQFQFTVLDPDLLFMQGRFCALGSGIIIGKQTFTVRVREMTMVGGQLGLSVTARSFGIVLMQNLTGSLVRKNLSATEYIRTDALACGLKFIGQATTKRSSITRRKDSTTNENGWTVAQRLAQDEGYWIFESAGTIVFGQPSWLAAHMPRYYARWRQEGTTDPLVDIPLFRSSLDDTTQAITGTLSVEPDSADIFVPGIAVQSDGISPDYDGVYLVTSLNLTLDGKSPGAVELSQPLNPVKGDTGQLQQPTTKGGSYASKYPTVYPGPLSPAGWTWPLEGQVRGSTASGISVYAAAGTPVGAPAAGEVVKVSSASGKSVRISHGLNIFSIATHLGSVGVRIGQQVSRGQVIGTVASATGSASPYVHFQVTAGTKVIDPTAWFPTIPKGG